MSSSEESNYIVERILEKRVRNGKAEYKVKWQGYPLADSTWEPIGHLSGVLYMVDEFDAKKSKKKDQEYTSDGQTVEKPLHSRRKDRRSSSPSISPKPKKKVRQVSPPTLSDSSDQKV